jgi:ABC-type uncharacterized transport system ATPase subunit
LIIEESLASNFIFSHSFNTFSLYASILQLAIFMSVIVSGLTKIYGEQHAVDNVSFEVRPGDILGFLGPNGAGKSTTMKIITGYIPPYRGKATVCGHDVETQPLQAKKKYWLPAGK